MFSAGVRHSPCSLVSRHRIQILTSDREDPQASQAQASPRFPSQHGQSPTQDRPRAGPQGAHCDPPGHAHAPPFLQLGSWQAGTPHPSDSIWQSALQGGHVPRCSSSSLHFVISSRSSWSYCPSLILSRFDISARPRHKKLATVVESAIEGNPDNLPRLAPSVATHAHTFIWPSVLSGPPPQRSAAPLEQLLPKLDFPTFQE